MGGAEVDGRSIVGVADLEGMGRGGRIGTGRALLDFILGGSTVGVGLAVSIESGSLHNSS